MIDSLPERPLSTIEMMKLANQYELFSPAVLSDGDRDADTYVFLMGVEDGDSVTRHYLVGWYPAAEEWRKIEAFPADHDPETLLDTLDAFLEDHYADEAVERTPMFRPEGGEQA